MCGEEDVFCVWVGVGGWIREVFGEEFLDVVDFVVEERRDVFVVGGGCEWFEGGGWEDGGVEDFGVLGDGSGGEGEDVGCDGGEKCWE